METSLGVFSTSALSRRREEMTEEETEVLGEVVSGEGILRVLTFDDTQTNNQCVLLSSYCFWCDLDLVKMPRASDHNEAIQRPQIGLHIYVNYHEDTFQDDTEGIAMRLQ